MFLATGLLSARIVLTNQTGAALRVQQSDIFTTDAALPVLLGILQNVHTLCQTIVKSLTLQFRLSRFNCSFTVTTTSIPRYSACLWSVSAPTAVSQHHGTAGRCSAICICFIRCADHSSLQPAVAA